MFVISSNRKAFPSVRALAQLLPDERERVKSSNVNIHQKKPNILTEITSTKYKACGPPLMDI